MLKNYSAALFCALEIRWISVNCDVKSRCWVSLGEYFSGLNHTAKLRGLWSVYIVKFKDVLEMHRWKINCQKFMTECSVMCFNCRRKKGKCCWGNCCKTAPNVMSNACESFCIRDRVWTERCFGEFAFHSVKRGQQNGFILLVLVLEKLDEWR